MTEYLLVCDVGGTSVKYGIFDGQVLSHQGKFPTPATWEEFQSEIAKLRQQLDLPIKGIGFSVPGTVLPDKGLIEGISAVPYIHHRPFVQEMTQAFQVPITIENDANCAAVAEVHSGAAQGTQAAALLVLGSGIGGALVLNGQLYRGPGGFAGEFGYGMVDFSRRVSPTMSPVNVARRYNGSSDFKALLELATQGYPEAKEAVDQMIDDLALLIHNLYVFMDLPLILIGGALSGNQDFSRLLEERVKTFLEVSEVPHHPQVRSCAHQADANLIGAGVTWLAAAELSE